MESDCLLGAEDRVFGGLGDAELHDALGRDLNLFPGGRIATNSGRAIHQDELAEPRQGESVLSLLVGQVADGFEDLDCLLLGESILLSDSRGDL